MQRSLLIRCHPERWYFVIIITNVIIASYALTYETYPVSSGLIILVYDPSSKRRNRSNKTGKGYQVVERSRAYKSLISFRQWLAKPHFLSERAQVLWTVNIICDSWLGIEINDCQYFPSGRDIGPPFLLFSVRYLAVPKATGNLATFQVGRKILNFFHANWNTPLESLSWAWIL